MINIVNQMQPVDVVLDPIRTFFVIPGVFMQNADVWLCVLQERASFGN